MVDVHGYLALQKNTELEIWTTEAGNIPTGVLKIMSPEKAVNIIIR